MCTTYMPKDHGALWMLGTEPESYLRAASVNLSLRPLVEIHLPLLFLIPWSSLQVALVYLQANITTNAP